MRILPLLALFTVLLAGCSPKDEAVLVDTGAIADLDQDGDGVPASEDCDDSDATINGGALEICDGLDNDCDGEVDEGVTSTFYEDADEDGYGDPEAVIEACSQPADTVTSASDCDDGNPRIFPGANELCNGLDDNCDGDVDEGLLEAWYLDSDGDGFGDPDEAEWACVPPSDRVQDSSDCDDTTAAAHPGAVEYCDEIDNDCDGDVDEGVTYTYWADADGDGFGDPARFTAACSVPVGYADQARDCDDTAAAVNPDATELCNTLDDDCDGTVDEDDAADAGTWWQDADGDGVGLDTVATRSCAQPTGFVAGGGSVDCDDTNATTHPGALETCDGEDDDCDGTVDEDDAIDASTWWLDSDSDGFGGSRLSQVQCTQPHGYVLNTTDCDDLDGAVFPGATEVCNDTDDDCDGATDEGLPTSTWYRDHDADGYGDGAHSQADCAQPTGHVASPGDCDDTNSTINPGALEYCDTIDNDCDGTIDENDAVDASTWWRDADGDGYGGGTLSSIACTQPGGYVSSASDCNDTNSSINPGASEVCNGLDDDCDGSNDEGLPMSDWYTDADGDGYGNPATRQRDCRQPSGTISNGQDCDDTSSEAYPGALERLTGSDTDCDGTVDESAVAIVFAHQCLSQSGSNSHSAAHMTQSEEIGLESHLSDLDLGLDRFDEPSSGWGSQSLDGYDLLLMTKCGWRWSSTNQDLLDELVDQHDTGVPTFVFGDDIAWHANTVSGYRELILMRDASSNGTSGTSTVHPRSRSVHPILAGSHGSVSQFTYDRDIDETTTWGNGETVLATRGSTSRPAWVAHTDGAGTRSASYLGSIDTCNHERLSSSARSNSEVLFKNTVEWLLDL